MAKVLLIGNFRPSLALARQLGKAGHAVVCGVDRPSPYLFASRYVGECVLHARIDERPAVALEHIRAYLAACPDLDAVIPVSESAVRLLSANRDAAPAGVKVVLPSARVVGICTAKEAMFDLCETIGVPVATRRLAVDRETLKAAVESIGRPCIIKPVDSPALLFGGKAVIVGAGVDVDTVAPTWPAEHDRLCIQRFVTGPRHNVVFAAQAGRVVGAVEFRAVRTDRVDHTGYSTVVRSVRPTPSIRAASETLLERLDYTGIGMLQFMLDEKTGEPSFLELNPRLGGTSGAAEACGLPICRLMLDLGLGRPVTTIVEPWRYPVGRKVVWTRGDLAGLAAEGFRGALTPAAALSWSVAALRDVFNPHHLTFDPRDLGPTVLSFVHPVLAKLGLGADLFIDRSTRRALEKAGSSPVIRPRRGGRVAAPGRTARLAPVGAA